jgi:hypothetical protein
MLDMNFNTTFSNHFPSAARSCGDAELPCTLQPAQALLASFGANHTPPNAGSRKQNACGGTYLLSHKQGANVLNGAINPYQFLSTWRIDRRCGAQAIEEESFPDSG